jgi:hypothetical protein
MKKMRTFLYVFRNSIFSFSYYRDVLRVPFSFSFAYFWVFSVLFGLMLTILALSTIVPVLSPFLQRLETRAKNLYPNDLVIKVTNGTLTTNVAEPLRFPIPYELLSETPPAVSDQNQTYLLTINTKGSPQDFEKSNSFVYVTANQFVVTDKNNSYRVYPLGEMGDFEITKSTANAFFDKIIPWFKFVPVALGLLLFFVFALALPVSRLISLLFLTLVLSVCAQLLKLSLSYRQLYQLGLHALTLPTIIQVLMTLLGLVPPIPFFNSLLYILYALIILAELRKQSLPVHKPRNS